jgi:signal transduction histidine kinase
MILIYLRGRGRRELRYLNALPRFLLTLPRVARLGIVALSVVFFLMLYMMTPAARNPSILMIPMALAAWMFRRRGMLICVVSIIPVLWVYYGIRMRSMWLSPVMIELFIAGTLALLAVGLLVSSQRDSLDLADMARQKLTRVYEQQQELSRLKDQLMLNLGHELRTPLTVVYGYLELLIALDGNLDSNAQMNFLKNAMSACDELQLLVNSLQDAGSTGKRMEAGNTEEVAVEAMVEDAVRYFTSNKQPEAQENRIQLDISEPLIARAHALYVRQVLRNLISNALKYSPDGTAVVVSARCHSNDVPEVCISVQDAGPGIPADEIPLLFGQFVRLRRDLSGPVRGIGLGLYISKQLVEAMGGRIWVESAGVSGQGSRFCFTLPRIVQTAAISEAIASPPAPLAY